MAQYRTGKAFVTNGSTTVFGDISTDWSSILLASWFALQGSEVTYTVAANAVQRNAAYFAAYAGGTTYAQNDRISYGGNMYASLQASNLAHQPDISPLWWVQISGWEITLTGSWASATSSNRTYGIVKDFSTIYGLPLPAAGDVETAAIITRAFQILELAVANAGFIADTRRGMSVDIDTATGDAYGMEQVSAAQTGDAKALRIYTSALNSSYLAFGKYTSDTAFTEWGRFNNSGILDLNALSFKLGTTFEVTLSQAVTANRAIVFPNADGTLALVASSVPSVQGTANQILINGGTAVVAGTAALFTLSSTLASITSVSAAAATNLTLNSGSSGGSLALVQGTNGGATLTLNGTGQFTLTNNGTGVNVMEVRNQHTGGFSTIAFFDAAGVVKAFVGYGNSASSAPYTNDFYIRSVTGADIINVINGVEVLTVSGGTIGTGAVTVRYTTTSTANNNGALVVAGGLGVAGTSWHGETVNVFKTSGSAFYTARQSGGAYASATAAYTMVSDNTTVGTNLAYAASRNGDTQYRFQINPDGLHAWGPGNAALDTNLYRNAANVLKTDDAFVIADATASTTTTSGALVVTGGVGIAGALFVGGNATLGTGANITVSLAGTVSSTLMWPSAGVAAPTFTSRSAGVKIVLYPGLSASAVDYGLGMEGSTIWYATTQATSTFFHKWYGGTTSLMTLRGDGILTLPINVASTTTGTGTLVVAGGVGIAGALYVGGCIVAINGAAATPSVVFTGATTTGFFWANPGVGVSVAAASVGTFTANGWIGAHNGTVGATTPSTGAFTTLSASGVITSTLITGTAPFTVASTTAVANLNASLLLGATWAAPAAIGTGTPAAGTFTTISATTLTATGNVVASNGAAATPSHVFSGATTTGLYWANPGVGVSVAAASVGVFTANGWIGAHNGTVGATTPSTGAFTTISASGVITSTIVTGTAPFTVASTTVVANLNVSQLLGATWASPAALGSTTPAAATVTNLTVNTNATFPNGAAATPTIDFVGATTTGLYWANPGIGFSVAGVSVGIWSATALSVTGNLLPTTTLTPDIGSSSFVWRSLYVRDIVATGGTQFGLSVQTGTYTMLATDTVVVCNSGSTFTVTMLAAASHTRRVYVLKNKGTATVTVDATGLGQIDGANTQPILAGNSLMLVSDGTTWNIV